MSIRRLINWLLALSIAIMLSASYMLDGPTDHPAAQAQASSLQDARQAAKQDQHLVKARKAAGVAL